MIDYLLKLESINIGFAAEDVVDKLKRSDEVTQPQLRTFKKGIQTFVTHMSKIFERSPLDSDFLSASIIFDPEIFAESS